MAQQIQLRNGTAAQWAAANPTLAIGEIGVETDTNLFKIGNGIQSWYSLGYAIGRNWKGTWSESATYYINDTIYYSGNSYLAIRSGTSAVAPNNSSITGITVISTTGQFSCTANSFTVGQTIVISGTETGTATISGYSDPTAYYIVSTDGTTQFTLSTTLGGTPITTTVGTTTLTFQQYWAQSTRLSATILSGAGVPGSGVGNNGDYYVDTTNTRFYGPKSGGAWSTYISLIGSPNAILSGAGAPSLGVGNNGDYYIDTTNKQLYGPKASQIWPGSPASLVVNANTFLNGSGAPNNSLGSNGDFYLDTANNRLYGPKASGVWPNTYALLGNYVYSGSEVPSNSLGNNGDFYIDITAKTFYGPKTLNTWNTSFSLQGAVEFPSQTGNSGKFLTTDGTTASWTNRLANPTVLNDISGQFNGATPNFPLRLEQDAVTSVFDSKDLEVVVDGLRLTPYTSKYTWPWIVEYDSFRGYRVRDVNSVKYITIYNAPASGSTALLILRPTLTTLQYTRYPFSATSVALGD
jgi:hypothetical protein